MPLRRLLLALTLCGGPLSAADTQVFGSAKQAMPMFGRLGSARLAALGGAFHSQVQGVDALLVNPAGIASVKRVHAGAHHEFWLADINQETLYAVTPVGEGRGFGAYAHVVDYGVFELRDSAGKRLGEMSARDYAVGVAAAAASRLGFSGGVGVRGVRENLISQDLFAIAFDTGVAWQSSEGWTGGISAINVGTSLDGSQGAESVRWGIARRFDYRGGWLWPALAFSWEPRVTPRLHLGAELRIGSSLDLRAGYQHRFVQTLLDGVQGLSLGLGTRVAGTALDYAFTPHGDLGAGHRLSVTWSQAEPKPRPAPTPVYDLPVTAVPPPSTDLVFVTDPLQNARRLEEDGRHGEALAEYERLTQEQPDLPGAWRGLADLAYQLGDKPKALRAYEQYLHRVPDPQLEAWVQAYRDEP